MFHNSLKGAVAERLKLVKHFSLWIQKQKFKPHSRLVSKLSLINPDVNDYLVLQTRKPEAGGQSARYIAACTLLLTESWLSSLIGLCLYLALNPKEKTKSEASMSLVRPLWDCYAYTQGCLSNTKDTQCFRVKWYVSWLGSVSLVHILISPVRWVTK